MVQPEIYHNPPVQQPVYQVPVEYQAPAQHAQHAQPAKPATYGGYHYGAYAPLNNMVYN